MLELTFLLFLDFVNVLPDFVSSKIDPSTVRVAAMPLPYSTSLPLRLRLLQLPFAS